MRKISFSRNGCNNLAPSCVIIVTLHSFGNGSMDEWTQFYEQYSSQVWATVYRIVDDHGEALDCCQDIFAELLKRSSTDRIRDWSAYLKWLATRRAIDRLRRRRLDVNRYQT